MQQPFDNDAALEMDGFDEGESMEDNMESEEAFSAEGGDGMDEAAGLDAMDEADAYDDASLEEGLADDFGEAADDEFEDGFDAMDDSMDEGLGDGMEDSFGDALEADSEDEFLGRLARQALQGIMGGGGRQQQRRRRGGGRQQQRGGGGFLGRMSRGQRNVVQATRGWSQRNPLLSGMMQQGLEHLGGPAGQALLGRFGLSPEMSGGIGSAVGGFLSNLLNTGDSAEAMDAMADAMADMSDDEMDAFMPAIATLGARLVTRAATPSRQNPRAPRATAQVGRAAMRATTQAARTLVRRAGPSAIRALPRVIRQVARTVRQGGTNATSAPRMIVTTAARVANSPRATARLSRPNPAARRLRLRAARAAIVRVGPGGTLRFPRGRPITIQIG
jgi:hypothetical protein